MRGSSSVAGNVGANHRRHIIVVCRLLKARLIPWAATCCIFSIVCIFCFFRGRTLLHSGVVVGCSYGDSTGMGCPCPHSRFIGFRI